MQSRSSLSWIQLAFFTAFLFLLVAIPYTLYIKATTPKVTATIINLPPVVKVTPVPSLTPPELGASTVCLPVPSNYTPEATPAAYLFPENGTTLCYPPALPPFPFTWQPYTSYQLGYSIDTPSNWNNKSTTVNQTLIHIFSSDDIATNTASVSFAWYAGTDPYASQSAYRKTPLTVSGQKGTIYTKNNGFIAAIFSFSKGYFLLEGSTTDSAFYAFQHMLTSLAFLQ